MFLAFKGLLFLSSAQDHCYFLHKAFFLFLLDWLKSCSSCPAEVCDSSRDS